MKFIKPFFIAVMIFLGIMTYLEITNKSLSSFLELFKKEKKIFQVYWVASTHESLDKIPKNINVVALAFADVSPTTFELETKVSGNFIVPPLENMPISEDYKTWTRFKYENNHVKILLSLGGETYSKIWSSTLEQNNAPTLIAKNIVNLINKKFPVYLKTKSTPNCLDDNKATYDCLAGYVTLDGIDLDAEIANVNLGTHAEKIIDLIHSIYTFIHSESSIKKHTENKEIVFTGISVGADPIGQCTVQWSVHCGEFRTIVQQTQEELSWVNLMAYDAGPDFIREGYKQALLNLSNLFEPANKHKSILGLNMGKQYGLNFPETPQELAQKVLWTKDSRYGGIMFWGIGNYGETSLYLKIIAEAFQTAH